MKRLTKALSMLLAIIMVVGLLPLSIIAEDIQNTHTVQFKLNYNGAHKIPSQKVADGECAVQPDDVTREGWIFEYWYVKTGNNGIQKFDLSQPITEDVTLYARWDEDITYWGPIWNRNILGAIADGKDDGNTYTVTFDANDSDVENLPAVQTVKAGECAVEPSEPTREGYYFVGWYISLHGDDEYIFSDPVYRNIILYARWINEDTEFVDRDLYITTPREQDISLSSETGVEFINNELIIHAKKNTLREDIVELVLQHNAEIIGEIKSTDTYQIKFKNELTYEDLNNLKDDIENSSLVSWVSLNWVFEDEIDFIPNDTEWNDDWNNINPDGDNWGVEAIRSTYAWDKHEHMDKVNVGIYDIYFFPHEDLTYTARLFNNDDVDKSNILISHGTHVSGTIAADFDNEKGISGVAPNAAIHGVSFCGITIRDSSGEILDTPTGIMRTHTLSYEFALSVLIEKYNCRVLNYSVNTGNDIALIASLEKNESIKNSAINLIQANSKELGRYLNIILENGYEFVICVAAGNSNTDVYLSPFEGLLSGNVQAKYNNILSAIDEEYQNVKDRIIVVGSCKTDGTGNYYYSDFSNVGDRVDVVAPGEDIFSTVSTSKKYEHMSGTSMATPHVSGVAAMLFGLNSNLTGAEVKRIIKETATIDVSGCDYKMINANMAVNTVLDDMTSKWVTVKFIDSSTNGNLTCNSVYMEYEYLIDSFGNSYDVENWDDEKLDLIHHTFTDGSSSNFSSTALYLDHGKYKVTYKASQYQNCSVEFVVDDNTTEFTIYMTPEGATPPAPETGYTVTGRLVSSADSSPITGMDVSLGNNSNTYYATTDSNGYFEFTNVAAATSYALETGDGINFAFYKDTDVSVSQNTDLGTIQLTPSETKTMRLRFVDSESKESLKISAIFENSSYVGIGHSGLDEGSEFIAGDFIDGRDGTNAFTVNNDSELVFVNVPVFGDEIWGNYYILFDSAEKEYIFPDKYTIASLDLVENTSNEWEVDVELVKTYLCVDDITVSNENASDILGDGSAVYNFDTKTLTLTNATLKNGDTGIDTNILGFNLVIPEGTTTYTKNAHSSIDAKRGVTISGSGVLYLGNSPDYYTVFNNYGSGDLRIKNTEIILDGSTGGIYCDNLVLDNASLTNTGVYGYSEFVNANSISIRNSTVDITSIGSNILWSHGGDININNSDVTLYCVDDELYSGYLLFAESASVNIDNTSTVNLVAPYAGTDEDHELLCATNGIILGSGLSIRNSAGKTCEIYQAGEGRNYSVRCTDGTYPNQIFVAMPGEAVPGIETVVTPDRITITDVDYTWSAYVQGGGGKFTLDGNFKLFGDYRPTVTTTWGDTVTVKNTSGKEYEFTIDVWDEWYNSDMNDGDTLGKIIISAGNKSKEITVVINGTFDVSFSY